MDDNEKKKEYLWQYQEVKKEMQRAGDVYKELRMSFYPSQSGGGGSGSHEPKDLSMLIVRVKAAEQNFLEKRYQSLMKLQEIDNAISRMTSADERNVLTKRYIMNHRWEDICKELNISWTQIHRIHSKALSNFIIPTKEIIKK